MFVDVKFFFQIKYDSDTLVNWFCNLHSMQPKNKTEKDDKGSKEARRCCQRDAANQSAEQQWAEQEARQTLIFPMNRT